MNISNKGKILGKNYNIYIIKVAPTRIKFILRFLKVIEKMEANVLKRRPPWIARIYCVLAQARFSPISSTSFGEIKGY
jgi:hypothetical protein